MCHLTKNEIWNEKKKRNRKPICVDLIIEWIWLIDFVCVCVRSIHVWYNFLWFIYQSIWCTVFFYDSFDTNFSWNLLHWWRGTFEFLEVCQFILNSSISLSSIFLCSFLTISSSSSWLLLLFTPRAIHWTHLMRVYIFTFKNVRTNACTSRKTCCLRSRSEVTKWKWPLKRIESHWTYGGQNFNQAY